MDLGLGPFLDVAIGVLSIMVIFSLAATAIQEVIAERLRLRPRTLEQGVEVLLASLRAERGTEATGLTTTAFYDHPSIRALMHGGRKPSAIRARRYAETVLDLLGERQEHLAAAQATAAAQTEAAAATVRALAKEVGREDAGETAAAAIEGAAEILAARVGDAGEAFERRVTALEREWNDTMDRVAGWYARKAQCFLFAIGLFLAAGANVNLPDYALRTLADSELQSLARAQAQLIAAGEDRRLGGIDDVVRELDALGAMAGWRCTSREAPGWVAEMSSRICDDGEALPLPRLTAVIGWVMIAFGTSLGAQFWYQLLSQALALRTSGRLTAPPEEAPRKRA